MGAVAVSSSSSDDQLRLVGGVLILLVLGIFIAWHSASNASPDQSTATARSVAAARVTPSQSAKSTATKPSSFAVPTSTPRRYATATDTAPSDAFAESENDPYAPVATLPAFSISQETPESFFANRCSTAGCSPASGFGCDSDQTVITESGLFYPPSSAERPRAAYCANSEWDIPSWADNGLDLLNQCGRWPGGCVAAEGGPCSGLINTEACIPYDSAWSWDRCDGMDCAYDPRELDGIDTGDPLDPDNSSSVLHKGDEDYPTPALWDETPDDWLKTFPDEDDDPFGFDDSSYDDPFAPSYDDYFGEPSSCDPLFDSDCS